MDGWLTWCQFWRKSTSRSLSTFVMAHGTAGSLRLPSSCVTTPVWKSVHLPTQTWSRRPTWRSWRCPAITMRRAGSSPSSRPSGCPRPTSPSRRTDPSTLASSWSSSTTGSGLSHRLLSWWCTTYPMTFTRQWCLCGPKQPATSGTCGLPLRRATLSWSSGPGGNSATKRPWGWRWPGPPLQCKLETLFQLVLTHVLNLEELGITHAQLEDPMDSRTP